MLAKFIKGFLATAAAAAALHAGSAGGYDLESNMIELNRHMIDLQDAFIKGDKAKALQAVSDLGSESAKLLADEAAMKKMLPPEKSHLVRIAVTSARMIDDNVAVLKESMDNTRRDTAQEAYLSIQRACMRCHNLVRDW